MAAQLQNSALVNYMHDVEQSSQNVQQDEDLTFTVEEDSSLFDLAKMYQYTMAGSLGFRVMNPEILYAKYRCKNALEEQMERLIVLSNEESLREINALDLMIAHLKTQVVLPNNDIPQQGPAYQFRGQGMVCSIYPPSLHGQFARQDLVPPPIVQAEATPEQQDAFRQRDVETQRMYWRFNIQALETKKKILQQKAVETEKELRKLLRMAVRNRSRIGTGHANYLFLAQQNDIPNAPPAPNPGA